MTRILVLLLAVLASATAQDEFTEPDYKRTPFGDTIDIASMKMLKKTYEQSLDKNVVTSPLGVLTLLSLYASGSEGKIRDEIMTLQGSTDYKQLSNSYSQLGDRFSSIDAKSLIFANKIFLSNKFTLKDEFSNVAKSYRNEVDSINFKNQKAAVDTINEWSSKLTKGMIDHPVSEDDIDKDTIAALVNVIFFQGHWHVPFNASNTKEEDFHVDRSTTVKKPMMHLLQPLFHRKNSDIAAKMIELPYKESNFRMVVVLPDEVDGLPAVLEKVSEKGLLEDIFQLRPVGSKVDLSMPKFEIRSKISLNEVLPEVGVSSIFERSANGIVKETGVVVSRALQEAIVKVDEEGATAGAFTGLVVTRKSAKSKRPEPIPFKVDRPFLYVILHDDIVLFAGTYTH